MKTKLTNQFVKTLIPKSKRYEIWDSEVKGFYIDVKVSGIKSYYLFYRFKSLKRKYFIGTHGSITTSQARDIAIMLAGQVAQGIDIQTKKKEAKAESLREAQKSTLSSFVDGPYKDWRISNRKRPYETLTRLRTCFFNALGSYKLDELNAWLIEKWRNSRLKQGTKPATVNRDLTDLKSALSKAVEWQLLQENPIAKVKSAKLDKNPIIRYLTLEEEARLRKALNDRDHSILAARARANEWRKVRSYPLFPDLSKQAYGDHLTPMVLISMNTGLRRGELFQLQWLDINFQTSKITVRGDKTKSGQTRYIHTNQEVINILHHWKKQQKNIEGLVFMSEDGKPFNNVKKAWTKLLQDAEISEFRWHDLRHHFASRLVMLSVDLNTVRELLGHKDISTTLRYAHLAPEHKAEAVERLVRQSELKYAV